MKVFVLLIYTMIIILGFIFSYLNAEPVWIHYYLGEHQFPLSVLLIALLLIGILCGAGMNFFTIIKLKFENRKLKKKLHNIQQEVSQLRVLTVKDEG